jgi:Mrp family chromosome partitioning ATPase
MGRMLQTLKQNEGRRVPPLSEAAPVDAAVQDTVVDWEIAEEVPYVEVGGPNKKVELSPGLLAHPAQAKPQPPHQPAEPMKRKTVELTPAQPMGVAYQAWPSAIPAAGNVSPEIIAYHSPDHATSKEYALLLDTILHGTEANGVLLFAGAKPNVGTSTVLLNLAVIAAQAKKLRVAVVETTRKQTSIGQRLGLPVSRGLDDVFSGALAIEQAITKTALPSLHLLPAGNADPVCSNEAVAWLCAWLRERYDLILIDGPTLEDAAPLTALLPHAHGVYLVLPQGDASGKGLAQSLRRLGGNVCGLIHTHFEM